MRLYEIENCKNVYSFDVDSINTLVLGDGNVFVYCVIKMFQLVFNNAAEAKKVFDTINQYRNPRRV